MFDELVPDLVLDDDHFLVFTMWAPDDIPSNRKLYGTPVPRVEKYGALIRHYIKKKDGSIELCEGSILFDGEWQRYNNKGGHATFWRVDCWEPLTVTPSLICHCGDHGAIREGRWEKR